MYNNDQHLVDVLGHSEDSIAEIWEGLDEEGQIWLLDVFGATPMAPADEHEMEISYRLRRQGLTQIVGRHDRVTTLGRAVAEYGRKAGV